MVSGSGRKKEGKYPANNLQHVFQKRKKKITGINYKREYASSLPIASPGKGLKYFFFPAEDCSDSYHVGQVKISWSKLQLQVQHAPQ